MADDFAGKRAFVAGNAAAAKVADQEEDVPCPFLILYADLLRKSPACVAYRTTPTRAQPRE